MENGYDDVASLKYATEHDLQELGVKVGHIRRIMAVSSTCLRQERTFGVPSSSRPIANLNLNANEFSTGESVFATKTIEQGSLLSEFASRLAEIKSKQDVLIDSVQRMEASVQRLEASVESLSIMGKPSRSSKKKPPPTKEERVLKIKSYLTQELAG